MVVRSSQGNRHDEPKCGIDETMPSHVQPFAHPDRLRAAEIPGQRPFIAEIDVIRAVACACVVAVHALGMVRGLDASLGQTEAYAGAFSTLFHFTREAFMIVTGLVLMYSYGRAPFSAGPFYGRRVLERVFPYAIWSLVYVLAYYPPVYGVHWWVHFGRDLLLGSASYQLYAMSVNIQFYLLFPLLWWILRRFPRSHIFLVLATLAAQVVWYVDVVPIPASHSPFPWLTREVVHYIFTYPFFFMLGAVVGAHIEAVKAFFDRHARPVAILSVWTGLVLLGRYTFLVFFRGESVAVGSAVLEPAMIFWSVGATALLYLAGRHLGQPALSLAGRVFRRVVQSVSRASFGIFIIHVMVLRWVFTRYAAGIPGGAVLQFLGVWSLTFGVSYLVTRILLGIPTFRIVMGGVSWTRPHRAPMSPPSFIAS